MAFIATSQLHVCSKYCARYKTRKCKPCITTSNTPNQPTEKSQLVKICKFRAPWLERMCKACYKTHKSLRFDICEDCRLTKSIHTNTQNVPYRPQLKTKVTYSIRFDRHNRFHSARPEICVRRNNPWVTTHNIGQWRQYRPPAYLPPGTYYKLLVQLSG